ncbi:TlpA family protein disulfide reductase [Belliella marina]|uniref:TlpA family protein disulfide reductase n=1 Tax=Belliella marina TaxID=1644146 RepID=A0ABW4VMU2_9BACT
MEKRKIFLLALLCLIGKGLYGQQISERHSTQLKVVAPNNVVGDNLPGVHGLPIVIYGVVRDKDHRRFMNIHYWDELIDPEYPRDIQAYQDSLQFGNTLQGLWHGFDKVFRFVLPSVNRPSYITLFDSGKTYLERYLVEPGDSIRIQFDNISSRISFAGPASPKFKCQQELDNAYHHMVLEKPSRPIMISNKPVDEDLKRFVEEHNQSFAKKVIPTKDLKQALSSLQTPEIELFETEVERILSGYRDQMPEGIVSLLKQEYFSKAHFYTINNFQRYFLPRAIKSTDMDISDDYKEFFFKKIYPLREKLWDDSGNSYHAAKAMDIIMRAEATLSNKGMPEIWATVPKGRFRDKVIATYLMDKLIMMDKGVGILPESLALVEGHDIREKVMGIYGNSSYGSALLEAEFYGLEGETVSTSSFSGKVTLIDFWYTGCKACIQLNESLLTPLANKLSGVEGFQMVSISADSNLEKWTKSLNGGRYSPAEAVHLFTGQDALAHKFLNYYDIRYFPFLVILDHRGKIHKMGFENPDYEGIHLIICELLNKYQPNNKF